MYGCDEVFVTYGFMLTVIHIALGYADRDQLRIIHFIQYIVTVEISQIF